ncbi:MAG: hypothetical protein WCF67_09695 [Chitinophagaceae bacterium]
MATETPVRTPGYRNLKDSFISLGLLLSSGIVGFIGQDLFIASGDNSMMIWMLIGLAFFLMVMSVLYAIITLTRTIKDQKISRSGKSQAAIIICIVVLVAVAYEILSRLMF